MKAVILAGGDSTRMRADKALLMIEKKNLIELIALQLLDSFEEIVIVTNNRLLAEISSIFDKYSQVFIHEDLIPDKGPMGGLYTAFNLIEDDVFFMTSCDNVIISSRIIDFMREIIGNYDVIAPFHDNNYEPLFAFYSRSSFYKVAENVTAERLSMQKLLAELNTMAVTSENMGVCQHEKFGNMNTKDEFQIMLPILREIEKKFTILEEK